MVAKKLFTLSTIEYILSAWANSVDPDQLAHLDLHCLLLDSSGYSISDQDVTSADPDQIAWMC
jgi:hypothetical protein